MLIGGVDVKNEKNDLPSNAPGIINFSKKGLMFFIAYTVALIVLFLNFSSSINLISGFFEIISPFVTGFVFAFLLNIPITFFEKKVFGFLDKKNNVVWNKLKRLVCFAICIVLIYFVIMFLANFIYGEIYKSIMEFSKNFPSYITHLEKTINDISNLFPYDAFVSEYLETANWLSILEKTSGTLAKLPPNLFNFAIGLTNAVFNFVMSLIFAIYLIFGKEKIMTHIRKIMYAYLPFRTAQRLRYITKVTNKIFTGFTVGQITETIILGTMYFIGTTFMRMPYPSLIAVLMAIGGLIPIIGPIITTIPSILIILMASGINQAISFVIMAVIFQQVESNIIYPKVIGESVGLPGIWVLLSVLVGSAVSGIFGMLVAVPTASVIYTLLRKDVNKKLNQKHINKSLYNPGRAKMPENKENSGENQNPKS